MIKLKKIYYSLQEAVDIINKELNLVGKHAVISETLRYWRKKGVINYTLSEKHGITAKITKEELNTLIGFAFLREYLGIDYNKISATHHYLSHLDTEHLNRYLNLYKPLNNDKEQ
jgi:hypothetical protein